MNTVQPNTRTSLICNCSHEAFNVITARAAFRHLMCGRVKGVDAVGNVVSWAGADIVLGEGANTLRWFNNEVSLHEDQPCLRSAPNQLTGEETKWAIPTIIICTRNFGYRPKPGQSISLRRLYDLYKGICQYCYEKIPYSEATRDHMLPKDKGGSNDDFNLVLACWVCNNKKDNQHPYYDIHGNEVKSLRANIFDIVPEGVPIRDEWKAYLYK